MKIEYCYMDNGDRLVVYTKGLFNPDDFLIAFVREVELSGRAFEMLSTDPNVALLYEMIQYKYIREYRVDDPLIVGNHPAVEIQDVKTGDNFSATLINFQRSNC